MTLRDVVDLAEAAFRQKRQKKTTVKYNTFTVNKFWSYSVSNNVFYRLMWSSLYKNPPQNPPPN